MKNVIKQMTGLLILLCVVLSLEGMFSPSSRISQAARRKLYAAQSNRAISQVSQEQPVNSASVVEIKQPSLWELVKSYFITSPSFLTQKKIEVLGPKKVSIEEIDTFLLPYSFHGNFDEGDLNRVKTQLGYIMNSDPDAKSYSIGTINEGNYKVQSLTILDRVLIILSDMIRNKMFDKAINPAITNRVWYYTEVIKFLMNFGAIINQENLDIYRDAFKTLIMYYRQALNDRLKRDPNFSVLTLELDWELKNLENIIVALIPVFNGLIPGFEQFKKQIHFRSLKQEWQNAQQRQLYQIKNQQNRE